MRNKLEYWKRNESSETNWNIRNGLTNVVK